MFPNEILATIAFYSNNIHVAIAFGIPLTREMILKEKGPGVLMRKLLLECPSEVYHLRKWIPPDCALAYAIPNVEWIQLVNVIWDADMYSNQACQLAFYMDFQWGIINVRHDDNVNVDKEYIPDETNKYKFVNDGDWETAIQMGLTLENVVMNKYVEALPHMGLTDDQIKIHTYLMDPFPEDDLEDRLYDEDWEEIIGSSSYSGYYQDHPYAAFPSYNHSWKRATQLEYDAERKDDTDVVYRDNFHENLYYPHPSDICIQSGNIEKLDFGLYFWCRYEEDPALF
ncbi:hypothetical protein DM01DRAFT_1331482 [Hesseltinella vesiculosa]|uniref:Uncharacterized protein n=1 Tax=Hesseltinella vesiculosa TaxID=101127 RepID=A0A1X2GVH6_9FUNG|nr:hypothetical protein DM01DRAFT_1331482 [Hesseltinella vesiculosa]